MYLWGSGRLGWEKNHRLESTNVRGGFSRRRRDVQHHLKKGRGGLRRPQFTFSEPMKSRNRQGAEVRSQKKGRWKPVQLVTKKACSKKSCVFIEQLLGEDISKSGVTTRGWEPWAQWSVSSTTGRILESARHKQGERDAFICMERFRRSRTSVTGKPSSQR